MKRPPGLWFLLSAGVLWLCIQSVYGVRATSLIFARSTTTTTEAGVVDEEKPKDEVIEKSEDATSETNSTKPILTGNPQIDYIYDPNLPRELNGYNLSNYPFYASMPKDIDFKCDGLHDGFYASVPHKCQVYHHCLFGTRFDFLCANYTAFDQKTFICQFVSEVDCVNSHKYWHRNDALYQTATTTTPKPITLPPTPPTQPPTAPARRPPARRRRPYPRRPYDDYEEEYDDDEYYDLPPRPRGRRRKPHRRRPAYDEYDEEEYDDRDRRPAGKRHETKNHDRREYEDRRYNKDGDDADVRKPVEKHSKHDEEDLFAEEQPKDNNKRHQGDNDRRSHEETPKDNKRYKDDEDTRYDRHQNERKRPPEDEDERAYETRKTDTKRPEDSKTRKGQRRPPADYYYDEDAEEQEPSNEPKIIVKPLSTSSVFNQPRKAPKIRPPVPKNAEDKFSYKPAAAKPAAKPLDEDEEYYEEYEEDLPPRRPLRKQEPTASESRRAHKPTERDHRREIKRPTGSGTRSRGPPQRRPVADYYDDYYEDEKPRAASSGKRQRVDSEETHNKGRKRPVEDEYLEEEVEEQLPPKRTVVDRPRFIQRENRNKPTASTTTSTTTTTTKATTTTTTTPATTTTKEPARERPDPVVRVVKRPFTSNRNGNPSRETSPQPPEPALDTRIEPEEDVQYDDEEEVPVAKPVADSQSKRPSSNRGQITEARVTAFKDEEINYRRKPTNTPPTTTKHYENAYRVVDSKEQEESLHSRDIFKPSPIIIKVPARTKYSYPTGEQEEFRPVSNRPQVQLRQNFRNKNSHDTTTTTTTTTTEKQLLERERNPLDITENDYDVTLNDALNPTLPNLPVRGFPTGFSTPNEYTYNTFNRPRYDVIDQNSRYQLRASSQRVETIAQPLTNPAEYSRYTTNPEIYQQPSHYRRTPQTSRIEMQRYYTTY